MSSSNRNSRARARQNNAAAAKETEATRTHDTEEETSQTITQDIEVDQAEPSMQLLAEAAQNSARAPEFSDVRAEDDDDRSSSLSDIDDRGATEGSEQAENESGALSEEEAENEEDAIDEEEDDDEDDDEDEDVEAEDENDTEAETERLEPSPDKTRKQRKVLLNSVLEDNASSVAAQEDDDEDEASTLRGKAGEDAGQLDEAEPLDSGVSSPVNSDTIDLAVPKSFINKKRKRANNDEAGPSRKRVSTDLASRASERAQKAGDNEASDPAEPPNDEGLVEADERSGDESQAEEQPDTNTNGDIEGEAEDTMEADASNVEDAELEETAQEGITSSGHSEEELKNKKAALEKLSDIEKDFALFRDKLFADRNMQLTQELSSIQADPPSHPEYLAMVAAIDKLRDERIDHAKNVYKYKLQALQRKAIVTRAMLQSQYMQRIRQQREKFLDQASEEWYQIQRERRNFDAEKEVPINHFSGERTQWVAAQTAYNAEVSILSGVAKYVGFPAAPEIQGVTPTEMEEDLRKMGISRQSAPPPVSTAVPQINKAKSGAEEQFIAETAWANPQHQQSQYLTQVHRQISNNARPASPVSTPAAQKRNADPVANGSASTIPVPPSSSLAPTPMSLEPQTADGIQMKSTLPAKATEATPSKAFEKSVPIPDVPVDIRLQDAASASKPPTSDSRTVDATGLDDRPPSPSGPRPEKTLSDAASTKMATGVQVGSS